MNKSKKTMIYVVALILGCAVLVFLDQWTKGLAIAHLKDKEAIALIPGVLELSYLENRGAAFGIFQNMQWFFYIATVVLSGILIFFYLKMPKTKRYLPLHILAIVLIAGAIGNFIDRVRFQYVVDFMYFSLIDFPIFNVADIYVTVSVIVLFILVLFVYKDEDYDFLKKKSK